MILASPILLTNSEIYPFILNMKTEYITIKRKQESKTSAKISLTTKNVDLDNPERM